MSTTGYLTQADIIKLKLLTDKAMLDSKQIGQMIAMDRASVKKRMMHEGVRYYDVDHDILKAKKTYYVEHVQFEDPTASNERLPHPFHRIMVDQKVSYLLGNPPTISVEKPDIVDKNNMTPEEQAETEASDVFREAITKALGTTFFDVLNDWAKGASNKSEEWLHFYITPKGKLAWTITDAEGIIPIYDTQYEEDLVGLVRYYTYEIIDEAGKAHTRLKVEWWTKQLVEYWIETMEHNFIYDTSYPVNPGPHWFTFNTQKPDDRSWNSWGLVPFVPLKNNSNGSTDLLPVKALIDAFDKIESGLVNDLNDFQELILVLKGYQALSAKAQQGLSELAIFKQNLRVHKVVTVAENGSVEPLRVEVPVEAKTKVMEILRREIFYFGMGVDLDSERFGGDASGVALKFLYSGLDLKANQLWRKMQESLKQAMVFIVTFINNTENTQYDPAKITFAANKTMIFNEKEKVESVMAASPAMSKETTLANLPYVDNVDMELKRIEAEEAKRLETAAALQDAAPDGQGGPGDAANGQGRQSTDQ